MVEHTPQFDGDLSIKQENLVHLLLVSLTSSERGFYQYLSLEYKLFSRL